MQAKTMATAALAAGALAMTAACANMQPAFAPKVSMESCVKAALAEKPGEVIEVEGEVEAGMPMFEIDIAGADGRRWELMCDGITGRIVAVKQESGDAKAPPRVAGPVLTEAEARKVALAARPGEVMEVEYEVESDGRPKFEYEIRAPDGTFWEVEIRGDTGEVRGSNRKGLFGKG
jgi:uncharacterized membrane protein YkoI